LINVTPTPDYSTQNLKFFERPTYFSRECPKSSAEEAGNEEDKANKISTEEEKGGSRQ
jgi:hypothetical protein